MWKFLDKFRIPLRHLSVFRISSPIFFAPRFPPRFSLYKWRLFKIVSIDHSPRRSVFRIIVERELRLSPATFPFFCCVDFVNAFSCFCIASLVSRLSYARNRLRFRPDGSVPARSGPAASFPSRIPAVRSFDDPAAGWVVFRGRSFAFEPFFLVELFYEYLLCHRFGFSSFLHAERAY